MNEVEALLEQAMRDACREARAVGYAPVRFEQMLAEQGTVATAHQLLASNRFDDGFTRLWELKRLDISLECLVLRSAYRSLFTAGELDVARRRLRQLDFDPSCCELAR